MLPLKFDSSSFQCDIRPSLVIVHRPTGIKTHWKVRR